MRFKTPEAGNRIARLLVIYILNGCFVGRIEEAFCAAAALGWPAPEIRQHAIDRYAASNCNSTTQAYTFCSIWSRTWRNFSRRDS